MYKKLLSIGLSFVLCMFAGCAQSAPIPDVPEEKVTLTVAGSWPDCRALDEVARAFNEKYPNCNIVYEYIQDYYPSLEKRMAGDSPVDLFFTTNIQANSPLLPYVMDLNSREDLDLSNTFPGLIENFTFREDSGSNTKLYAIPLGAEMRGLYVNTTLLSSLKLEVPTDQSSLLSACETLKQNGYIPFHGNPGSFAQLLVYPWICNLIANADDPAAAYARVAAHEPGLSEMFREPYEFLYTLVENDYYDYKRVQTELDLFNVVNDDAYARDFLHIKNENEVYEKVDDLGQVAFMPSAMSLQSVINKTKEDYHSAIEYVFIPAPVSKDGGFAYLSPAHGIAAGNASPNVEWSIKFLDFLFTPEKNELFAKAFNVIPNTSEALSYLKTLYDLPNDHISQLGQVTFDYGFYDMLQDSLASTVKANNPKYMQDDGNGNLSLYPFEHYLDELEASISAQ